MEQNLAFLGIDVSKGYADFMFLDGKKKPIKKPFQLDDNLEGHLQLESLLKQMQRQQKIEMFYCGVESTGGFENNWFALLKRLGQRMPLQVSRLNPAGIKANITAGLKRNITDALSSQYIAEYLIAHSEKVDYEQESKYSASRSLYAFIELLKKQQTQLSNELTQLLYSAFPELLVYCRNGLPVWLLTLLTKYPTGACIKKKKPEQLAKIKGISLEKANALLKKARESVAIVTEPVMEHLIKNLAQQVIEKNALVETQKKLLEKTCKGPEIELLKSITGFGDYNSAVMMIEIEDIKRFATAKKLTSYFGIHPVLKQSGDKIAFRMSKKGRSAPRGVLYMAGMTAIRCDEHIKAIYHRQRKLGKNHYQAMGAVMSKLLRIVYGVLKNNSVYNVETDQANIQKNANHTQKDKLQEQIKNKRRYQQWTNEAPISNRHSKKRKVHLQSQTELIGEVRDQVNAP